MTYRSVGNRCAVDFIDMHLFISISQSLEILREKGFQEIEVDLVELAQKYIGVSTYRRSAQLSEAPQIFDCSSFTKWVYAQKGVWLPRRSIQQREFGTPVGPDDLRAGDLVFATGHINYYVTDVAEGVGHVGIATANRTVIHAANRSVGIIESPFNTFIGTEKLRGIRRLLPEDRHIFTFITPREREVEWSDDLKWIILQSLPE